jgi:hypothetical protein
VSSGGGNSPDEGKKACRTVLMKKTPLEEPTNWLS